MDQDPYSRFVDLGRRMAADSPLNLEETSAKEEGAAVRLREGKVKSVKPLIVNVAGFTLPTKSLRINERLTKGAKWRTKTTSPNSDYKGMSGPSGGVVDTPGHIVSIDGAELHANETIIDEADVEQLELDLAADDRVLLLTLDDQIFYIVMKVVDAV